MDTSVNSADTSARARRSPLVIGTTVACLLIGAVVLASRDDGTSTVDAGEVETPWTRWTRLPDPPLSPRVGASAAWTGEEVIVVGGWKFLCPPGADCAGPTEAPFTDGAAFDPSTQTWRPIADAPAAFEGEDPAVARGSVFILVDCDVSFVGAEEEPAEERCPSTQEPTVLLRYDPEQDTWSQFPGPTGDHPLQIEAVGDSIIAFAGTEERGDQAEWHFDIESAVWTEIPDDPLPLMYDRSIVAVDDGRTALLFGADSESGPTSEPSEEVNLAARLDLETMAWTELPSSPSRGYRAWGVDDVVVLEPHFGGSGGLFDPSSSAWSALTANVAREFNSDQVAGVLGQTEAIYVNASGWVLDLARSEWLEIEPIDDRSVFPHTSVTAAGRDLFSFGGERWTSSDGELLGDAWLWIAPTSESEGVSSTTLATTTSTAPANLSTTTPESKDLASAEILGGLTVRLELESTVIGTGTELPSRLIVENRSDAPVTDPGCVVGAGRHALLPARSPDGELWIETIVDCGGPFTYEPGFIDTYDGPRFPARTQTGEPLSPGDYLATMEIDDIRLSSPLTVTAR